jgi:hypothetical protein
MKKEYQWVCLDCGKQAMILNAKKKYGDKYDESKVFPEPWVSTFHMGICDVCGENKAVTQHRDYRYVDFALLEYENALSKQTVKSKSVIKRLKSIIGKED